MYLILFYLIYFLIGEKKMANNENAIRETVKFGEGAIEVSLSKKDLRE